MSKFARRPLKHGDVLPANVLRDEYGMNAENRPHFKVAAEQVPQALCELIPYVERWAIPCDVTRHDYFDKQSEQDVVDFYYQVLPFEEQVHEWLDGQPENIEDWPQAAIQYMYFMKAHSEAYQPTEEELVARAERDEAWQDRRNLEEAVTAADKAFRAKTYDIVVQLLSPFDGKLDNLWAAKLVLAKKRSQ